MCSAVWARGGGWEDVGGDGWAWGPETAGCANEDVAGKLVEGHRPGTGRLGGRGEPAAIQGSGETPWARCCESDDERGVAGVPGPVQSWVCGRADGCSQGGMAKEDVLLALVGLGLPP